MFLYRYIAKNSNGEKISGVIEAENQPMALEILRKKEVIVISLKEEKAKELKKAGKVKVGVDDLAMFSRQLSTMIDSGIPLAQALDVLAEQTEKKVFAQVIMEMRKDVEEGTALSDTLSKHPETFSNLFVNMVKAGEASGMLDDILERLALYLEKTSSLQRKVRSSLIYPIVVSSMALLITAVLLLKVIPTFKGIFTSLGGQLPLPTQILIGASDALLKFWYFVLFAIFLIVFLIGRYISTEAGRKQCDKFLLKMPIFGDLFRKVAVAKFSRTLSTLIKSGVSILVALDIVGKTAGNKVVEDAVNFARKSIREGESIAKPLTESKVFPSMVVRMISVGEQTGELEKMLSKIADFYDEQVDALVSGLTSMIEPLIIAFLGIIIGSVVIALFMPIFKITELIAK